MSDCGKCAKSMKNVKLLVSCADCKASFHAKCAELSADELNYLSAHDQIWRCAPCGKTRRKSMLLESKSEVSYEDIFDMFNQLKAEFKRVETSIGASLESCHVELASTKAIVTKQGEDIKQWMAKVESLNSENDSLRKKVVELEARQDDMDQYSRRNTLEIHGVPMEQGENVLSVIKSVGRALDYPVEDSMIDACHRLRGREAAGKPPGIVVKFVRRLDSEGLLHKRRVKRNLSTRDLGMTSPAEVVYVNESLCLSRRRLLNSARQVKQEKQYTYLWIRGGKILMRKSQGDPVKVLTTVNDLGKL